MGAAKLRGRSGPLPVFPGQYRNVSLAGCTRQPQSSSCRCQAWTQHLPRTRNAATFSAKLNAQVTLSDHFGIPQGQESPMASPVHYEDNNSEHLVTKLP